MASADLEAMPVVIDDLPPHIPASVIGQDSPARSREVAAATSPTREEKPEETTDGRQSVLTQFLDEDAVVVSAADVAGSTDRNGLKSRQSIKARVSTGVTGMRNAVRDLGKKDSDSVKKTSNTSITGKACPTSLHPLSTPTNIVPHRSSSSARSTVHDRSQQVLRSTQRYRSRHISTNQSRHPQSSYCSYRFDRRQSRSNRQREFGPPCVSSTGCECHHSHLSSNCK